MFQKVLIDRGIQTEDAECNLMEEMFNFANLVLVIKVTLLWILLLFVFYVCLCCVVLSAPSRLVITCWVRADLFGISCVMFPCFFLSLSHMVTWVRYDTWLYRFITLKFAFFFTFMIPLASLSRFFRNGSMIKI